MLSGSPQEEGGLHQTHILAREFQLLANVRLLILLSISATKNNNSCFTIRTNTTTNNKYHSLSDKRSPWKSTQLKQQEKQQQDGKKGRRPCPREADGP